jgi:hypothetical protein
VADTSSRIRIRLTPTVPAARGERDDPRTEFWVALFGVNFERAGQAPQPPGAVPGAISEKEHAFINRFPLDLYEEIRQGARRAGSDALPERRRTAFERIPFPWKLNDSDWRDVVDELRPESFRVAIVGYSSFIFDLSFIGDAARSLLTDSQFIDLLVFLFVPAAFGRAVGAGQQDVRAESGDPVRTAASGGLDRYWALANLSLVPVAALLALLGYVAFVTASEERVRVLQAYKDLVAAQDAFIQRLSSLATRSPTGAGATPAAPTQTGSNTLAPTPAPAPAPPR